MENLKNDLPIEGELNQVENSNSISFENTLKILNSINENNDDKVDKAELEKALNGGFFDNEGNIKAIAGELNKYSSEQIEQKYKEIKEKNKDLWNIIKSFNNELEKIVSGIFKKEKSTQGNLSNEDIKILQLWEVMFGNILKTKLKNKRLSKKSKEIMNGYENDANSHVDDINQRGEYYNQEDQKFVEEYLDLWGYKNDERSEMLLEWISKGEIVAELEEIGKNLMGYEQCILKSQMGWTSISQENITNFLNTMNNNADNIPLETLIICDKLMGQYFEKFTDPDTCNKIKEKVETGLNNKINEYNIQIQKLSRESKTILKKQLGVSEVTKENINNFERKGYEKMQRIMGSGKMEGDNAKFCVIYYKLILDKFKDIDIPEKQNIEEKVDDIYNQNILGINGLSKEQAEELQGLGNEYTELYNLLGCGNDADLGQKIQLLTEGNDFSENINQLGKIVKNFTDKIWGKDVVSGVDKTVIQIWYHIFGEKEIKKIVGGSYNKDNISLLYTLNKSEVLNNEDKGTIKKWIGKNVSEMSTKYNQKIVANQNKGNFCTNELDIKLIQLQASVNLDDKEIKITGKKSKNYDNSFKNIDEKNRLTNEQRTDMYILRQEVKTRGEIIELNNEKKNDYSEILNMPNIDNLIKVLGLQELQDKVLGKFFNEVYLPIKKDGLYFENQITGDRLEGILINMINAERFKDTPVDYEVTKWKNIQEKYEDDQESDMYKKSENMVQILSGYKTLGEYYTDLAKINTSNLLKDHNNNIIEDLNKKLDPLIKELSKVDKKNTEFVKRCIDSNYQAGWLSVFNKWEYKDINEWKKSLNEQDKEKYEKLTEQQEKDRKEEYKRNYKGVVDKFIKLWRNETYRRYLNDSNLATQIFVEIYCLWDQDEIIQKFGSDIRDSTRKVRNSLNFMTDTEEKEVEETLDLYHSTMDAEKNIEKGQSERGESHYTGTRKDRIYYSAVDNTATQHHAGYPAGYIERDIIIHHDNYFGNGYNEEHSTAIGYKEAPSIRYPQGREVVSADYDPNKTIVGPDENGWYAILPDRLKEKSNKGQIKLAIIRGQPCVYEFMKNGDIQYRVYDKGKKQLIYKKTMTQAEYQRALTIENSRMKMREAEHGEEFKEIQKEMAEIISKNEAVEHFFGEYTKGDLDGHELDLLRKGATQFYEMVSEFATIGTRQKLINMRYALGRLNQNSNDYENPHEKTINGLMENINKILSFATGEQVKKAKEFKNLCLDTGKIHENDNVYDHTRQERLQIAVTFVAAVGMTLVAIHSFGLGSPLAAGGWTAFAAALGIGAISTASSMYAGDITQILLDKYSSGGTITVDGKEYKLEYNNPTLLQQALDPTSKVTRKDCVKGYGRQFVSQTVLQALLMRGGAEASQFLTKLMSNAAKGSFAQKTFNLTQKVLCRDFLKRGDAYTEGIINSVQKQVTKESFLKEFFKEIGEESREEAVEQAAEAQGAILGIIATVIHCIKPHPGQALSLSKVGRPKLGVVEGKLLIENTYDASNPNNLELIENYYRGIEGYSVESTEGGLLRITATQIEGKNGGKHDVELVFKPSQAPLLIRSLPSEFLAIGGINVDENTGEITYQSRKQLELLSVCLQSQNIGMLEIHEDGSAVIISGKETVTIKPEGNVGLTSDTPGDVDVGELGVDGEKATDEPLYIDASLPGDIETAIEVDGEKVLSKAVDKVNENIKQEKKDDKEGQLATQENQETKTQEIEIYARQLFTNEKNNNGKEFGDLSEEEQNVYRKRALEQFKKDLLAESISPLVRKLNNSVFEHVINSQELKQIASQEIENGTLEIGENGEILNVYVEVNGEKKPSKLFTSLTSEGLSPEQALKSWLQTRTTNFKEWFGDWQNNPESASKIVDENGEPLVMWHGTTRQFNEFRHDAPRNYENIGNTKDWFYFSNAYNFTEKEYSGIGQINQALTDFYSLYAENYEGNDRLENFTNKRNTFIEGLSNGKTEKKNSNLWYEGKENQINQQLAYCLNGQELRTENFEKKEWIRKVECEDGEIESIPVTIYVPKGNVYHNPLPFFIKGNNINQGNDFTWNQVITDMDHNINKAIENGNDETDIIRVDDKNTGNIVLGVRDATQIKSAVGNDGSFSPDTGKFNDYFGKKPKLAKNMDSTGAYSNSEMMDYIANTINEENQSEKLSELREEIQIQYQKATGKEIQITDNQLLSIIEAHKQKGSLGNLSWTEVRRKDNILKETIENDDFRRFLFEAGFCGSVDTNEYPKVDPRATVTQKQKDEIRTRLEENQKTITDRETELNKLAQGNGLSADTKAIITEVKKNIDKAKDSLKGWINGTGKQYNTIEEFLEEHQLSLNEGKLKIDGKELKRKKIDNSSKMLLYRLYYESIFKPLGLEIFADPEKTLGENVDRKTFLDEKHYSENFKISENDKFKLENGKPITSQLHDAGNEILNEIATVDGRKKVTDAENSTENSTENIKERFETLIKTKIETIKNIDPIQGTIATELRASIQAHSKGKIDITDQAYLFATSMDLMADYMVAYPDKTPEQVFRLLNSNQNKILHQHLWDLNTITSSDHGIKHILRGNMANAENVFRQLDEGIKLKDGTTVTRETIHEKYQKSGSSLGKLDLDQFKAKMKTLTRQAIIDHDLGYTNVANQAFDIEGFTKGFHMVSDHPLWSTIWVEGQEDFYKEIFEKDGYNTIRESLPGHGSAQTQNIAKILDGTATEVDFVWGILSNVDCAGSPADYKIAMMFAQTQTIGQLFNVYALFKNGDVEGTIQSLENLAKTIENMSPSDKVDKNAFKSAVSAFLFGGGIDANGKIEFGFKEKIENAYENAKPEDKTKLKEKAEKKLQQQGIKEGDPNYEQLLDAEAKKQGQLDMINTLFGFKLGKFLGAFGIQTTLNENGNPKGRINEHGGWSIDFELSGKSAEILAEQFGAGVVLKSFIGVGDDYHINDKGPTSNFLISQVDQAIMNRKYDKEQFYKDDKNKGKKFEGELKNYIKERLDPNHKSLQVFGLDGEGNIKPTGEKTNYQTEMDKFMEKFNKDGRERIEEENKEGREKFGDKREEKVRKNVTIKDGQFVQDGEVESRIQFADQGDGIVIHGPNNVEITLNFDGNTYEGFNETAGRFLEMNQMIDMHKNNIIEAKQELEETKERYDGIAEHIGREGAENRKEEAKDKLGAYIDNAAQDLHRFGQQYQVEGQLITTEQRDPITKKLTDLAEQNPEEIDINEFISKMESLRTKYNVIMRTVQSSNPALNN